ncbi:bifunctional glutathione transferase/peroxidase [Staphylotrichum longicolle]|uniref:Glycylpeptide N-tetradecanoyltransferase n=1 Tax=Staphylotrichum longicolle TaxID=669026 RepID=A0AAD4I381_9PEZI|nr:bifunctional glutathione transferase/peroxidase [Staphylotrichum longicolle]
MSEESKQVDPTKEREALEAAEAHDHSEDESGSEAEDAGSQKPAGASSEGAGKKKKKKGKKNKVKQALSEALGRGGVTAAQAEADPKKAIEGLTPQQISEFIALNPALANELLGGEGSSDATASAIEAFKKLKLQDIMTGLASSGKNRKDMASYKFWSTQPVLQFGEEEPKLIEEGPLKLQEVKDIPTEPIPLALEAFRWVTMDLTNEAEMEEVEKLLYGHYVEDDEAMFRFKYSNSLLKWSLLSPGWKKEWHVGIRSGNTLCAFISAIPTEMRVRNNVIHSAEVNFLCIHKKLRGKRLAPVLIKEITRRVNLEGTWQAIYTGGIVLPRPVSTCRYYHRALDWTKLYEVGFSPCPPNSKPSYQARKYTVPQNTSTRGLREMEAKDLDAVHDLLERYLKRFDLTPVWDKTEIEHWLLHKRNAPGEQVIWSYVVEDANGKVTDFFSFYCLESSVIQSQKYSSIRAAYLFYYASDVAFSAPDDRSALKTRLNALMGDALVLAKRHNFDVFNALSLMDNSLFLEQQKFGPGDGQLHYYLFNYKANPIHGGVNKRNQLEDGVSSGVGFVML